MRADRRYPEVSPTTYVQNTYIYICELAYHRRGCLYTRRPGNCRRPRRSLQTHAMSFIHSRATTTTTTITSSESQWFSYVYSLKKNSRPGIGDKILSVSRLCSWGPRISISRETSFSALFLPSTHSRVSLFSSIPDSP